MKKIFFLLLFISAAFLMRAQFPVNSTLGSKNTTVLTRGIHAADSAFRWVTNYADTATANLGGLKYVPGAAILVNNILHIRNSTATSWVAQDGSPSLTFSNGLTESGGVVKLGGTLTENTHLVGQNKDFFMDSLSGFKIMTSNAPIYGNSFASFQNSGIFMSHNSTGNFMIQGGRMYFSGGQSSFDFNTSSGVLNSVISNGVKMSNFLMFKDSIIFKPNEGKIYIDSLNTVPSTAGRKVLVHDTATGKVERVDPALLGGGAAIEVTQSTAVSLVTSSSLTAGSTYKITGVQPTLYDDGTYSGTTIFLKAETTSLFEKKGFGLFYNPKYDKNITGFGVVDTSASYSVGDTVYWGHYAWVCNTGGLAVATDILNLDGNWTKLPYSNNRYNAVLDEIEYDFANDWIVSRREADANNIISCSKSGNDILVDNFAISYPPISVFMWGNRYDFNAYKGVGGNAVLESYFECTNLYDGTIQSNTLSSGSTIQSNTLSSGSTIQSNTLSSNSYISSNTLSSDSYISSNTLSSNSYISSNTLSDSYISSNTLSNSNISSNTLSSNSCYISSNTLSDSYIYSNTLSSSSNISSNTLSSSNIYLNTLSNSSNIDVGLLYNLSGKEIKYITGEYGTINVDITSATVVFGDYPKTLFRLPDGTFKLRYYNNSGTLVVANVTD